MASTYWIKLYHEILHDPKMGRLPDRVWRRAIEMFLLAGEQGDSGTLPPVPDMAWTLRVPEETLIEDLTALAAVGIITRNGETWIVTRFAERQSAAPDTERSARYRERKRHEQYTVTGASRGRHEAVTTREVESEKSRVEADAEADAETGAEPPDDSDSNDAATAELFQMVTKAGILVNSAIADQYIAVLDEDAQGDMVLLRACFEEAALTGARPMPKWLRSVVWRCRKEGCMPGQWRDNGGDGRSRDSPPPRPIPRIEDLYNPLDPANVGRK